MQYVVIRPQLVASRSICKSCTYVLKFNKKIFAKTHKKPHKWLKFFTNRRLCTGLLLQLVFLSDRFSGYWNTLLVFLWIWTWFASNTLDRIGCSVDIGLPFCHNKDATQTTPLETSFDQ